MKITDNSPLKIGDKVRIISYDNLYQIKDEPPSIVDEMFSYANRICTIKSKVEGKLWYKIEEDGGKFVWPEIAFVIHQTFNKKEFLKLLL